MVNVAAILVAWHGILLTLPHNHHEKGVPQYAEICTATHPGSQVVHLHPTPDLIPPHGCLACLVSSVHGTPVSWHQSTESAAGAVALPVRTTCRRSDTHRHLPSLRAPPFRG